ncbi:MAG: PIN domain-containing protein [Phycisphaerae bacterium]|nr:PIN domain-containing protein [Phycisphaerae bacterium]
MARIYLETSFFSACVSDRTDPKSLARRADSRRWWVQQRGLHELLISVEVLRELSSPSFPQKDEALLLTSQVSALPINQDARGLARILVREKAMPGPEEAGDAVHLAVAIVHQVDCVLSWNVRHLANPRKIAHLREICRRAGYVVPEITTPDVYWDMPEEE